MQTVPRETAQHSLRQRGNPWRLLRVITPLLACCFLALCLCPASRAEQIVTLLYVNEEKKGEIFVHRTETGDFLVRSQDLTEAGLREAPATVTREGGEALVSLRSIPGVTFSFDEKTITLHIQAAPSLFHRRFIDFAGQPVENVYYPKESSLFFNYGLQYQAEGFSFQGLNLTNELGIRRGECLFIADTLYTKDSSREEFVRLHTSIIRDDRQGLRRTTFGDLFASSGPLGSTVDMGGIGFSKVFGMDPYLITYPTLDIVGQAPLPSEVDIYVNGVKIRTERISPGEFQLRNFTAYGGAGVVDLVIRDSFGREQRYRYPFYSTDNILLKKGLHDYSYNAGFLRENLGAESNRYTKPVLVAYHRYGLSDFLTLGFRGEAARNAVNAGPQAAISLWTYGILNLSLSGSASGSPGFATDASYSYQNGRYNARLFYQYFSRHYGLIASYAPTPQQNKSAGAGFGYTHPSLGSLSLDLSTRHTAEGTKKNAATLGYSRNFFGSFTVNATFSMTHDSSAGNSSSFTASITYTPKTDLSISARHESTKGKETQSVQIQKNAPLGEGFGYRALVQREERGGVRTAYALHPMLQFNGRHGILRGEVSAAQSGGRWTTRNQVSVSGALVALDGTAALTRPVTDSFAMVKVGDIEGVTVQTGGQDIGKTDSSGKVILTNITSYTNNLISINDKDIPIEYYYPVSRKYVSPPLRGGACIAFVAKRMQPVTGSLHIRINGEVKPVEFYEAELQVEGKTVSFPTGKGGEFYMDISQRDEFRKKDATEEKACSSIVRGTGAFLKPGTYQASVPYGDKRHTFRLTIPESTDPIIDVGRIVFEASP